MFGQQPSIRPNAPVCAFYQKGQCKYGTQCWNLHPPNQGAAVAGMAPTFGGNVFGAKTSAQADSKEFTEFMKQVSVEMSQWERNGQWLFSSFTPLKSHPLLAGFSDHSPEEMRVKSYDALKTSTFTAYQDQWNKLQQQYKQLRDALRGPTSDAYQAMKEVFYSKSSSDQQLQNPSQNGKSGSLFGKPAGTLFAGNPTLAPQPSAGLLGPKPQSSIFGAGGGGGSIFGGNQSQPPNMFGDSAKKTLFGGPAALGSQNANTFGSQPNASPFGGGNANLFKSGGGSVFGGNKMQGSLFGGTPATTQTSGSIFGGGVPANTTTASIFGGGTSANPVTSTTGSIFGGGNNTNPVAPATASIFGGNSGNAAAPAAVSTFGGGNNTATSTSGSVFGGGQSQTPSIFGNSSQTTTPTFGFMGGPATTSTVFGTSNTTSNVFGSSNTNTTSGSIFGNKPSLFGGSQNQTQAGSPLFGNAPSGTTSMFGGNPVSETQPQNASVFGLNTTPGSTFGGSGNTNPSSGGTGLFGGSSTGMQSGSIFGNTGDSSGSTGLFGKQPDSQASSQLNTASQIIGGSNIPGNVKAEWFTPMDQLDPADKGQFEAEVFTSIPLCPPPVELCF